MSKPAKCRIILVEDEPAARKPLGCIVLDVDRFKKWNDTHGQAIGDGYVRPVGGASQASEAVPADTVTGHSSRVRRKPRADALESAHAHSDHKR